MAFKIKDNLDLYGNQLLNFALQSDSGFPQSPQVGHMFNYTGTGVMANHAVMCVDETTKAFKALAFVDEIATNAEFVELKEKVDLLIGDDVDTDTIINSWKEVQAFLADIEDTKTLQGMLSSYLPKSGGILRDSWSGGTEIRRADSNNGNVMLSFSRQDGTIVGGLGFGGIDNPIFVTQAGGQNPLLHSGNYATEIGDYYLKSSGGRLSGNLDINTETDTTKRYFRMWYYASNRKNRGMISVGDSSVSLDYYSPTDGEVYQITVGRDGFKYNANYVSRDILHSGNIGEYKAGDADKLDGIDSTGFARVVSYPQTSDSNWNIQSGIYSTLGGTEGLPLGSNGHQVIHCNWDGNAASQLFLAYDRDLFAFRRKQSNVWKDWKTIAFTDSDITGNAGSAYKLVASDKSDVVTILPDKTTVFATSQINYGGHYFKKDDSYIALFGTGEQVDATKTGAMIYAYGSRNIYLYTSGKERMTINSSGNVGIGTTDPKKKLHVVGDLYVEGNIIATKEVSAGGAGKEGESGAGGAEVIDAPIPSGVTTYTISNTIGRSAVAVSLYEANVINGQTIWSLCLADIEVTDSQITVTFGSATSVNHKLVAVG